MNEIGMLRNQLAAERTHVLEVASACAAAHAGAPPLPAEAALEAFSDACARYLRRVLGWFEQRDRRLGELYARAPAADRGRQAFERIRSIGGSGQALAKLPATTAARGAAAAVLTAHEAWAELARFLNGPWNAWCGALEPLLASNPRVKDWRTFAGIDADSVVEERSLYARVRETLPAGIELVAGPV
jgi:hypothetical protein